MVKLEVFHIDSEYCISLPTGYYEYPYDCSAYISCINSHPELEYCPEGKLFNPQLHICDTPEAVKCNTLVPDVCEGLPNFTLLPSVSECNQYIECTNGKSVIQECPGHLWFNSQWLICDDPDEVSCDITTSTRGTTLNIEQDTSTTEDLFIGCLYQEMGTSLPFAKNCQEYYFCWGNGSYSLFPCPVDNWYSPYTGNCGPDVSSELCREGTTATTSTVPVDNPCESQELGASFPRTSNCNEYILCLGSGQSTIAKCPVNAWFDPQTGDCGPNVSPTACQEKITTVIISTTTGQPDNVCADQDEGTSLPLVTDCQKYILCMGNGESVIVRCISNSWFDPQTEICGPNVSPTACQESEVSSTSKPTIESTTESATNPTSDSTSETTVVYPPDLGICFGQIDGQYISYPDNCEKYILCAVPVPIAFYCTPGYYFSEKQQKCVNWQDSDCPGTGSEITTTLWPMPSPNPTVCTNSTQVTLPYPDNCQWFIRCLDDYVYMMGVCNDGEFYDPWKGECGVNVSPEACREYSETTTTVTNTEMSSTFAPTNPPTAPPQIDPCGGVKDGKLVPYPDDCTRFIICIKPTPIVGYCVEGQEFSAQLERCMAPWYANCSIIITTTTKKITTTTEILPTESTDNVCAHKDENAFIPYPHNCSKYIICRDPIPVGYECPIDEEFSPIELICMDPQLANCNEESKERPKSLANYLLQSIGLWFL